MTLNAPYFGQDISELEKDCMNSIQTHFKTEPKEDLSQFNPNVKTYGHIWADVCEKIDGVFVVAGISGNMTGVPIALFDYTNRDDARRYAAAFQRGKVFTIMNDERWCDYINAAHEAKSLDSGTRQWLISKGRKSGMTIDGGTYSQDALKQYFCAGGDFE